MANQNYDFNTVQAKVQPDGRNDTLAAYVDNPTKSTSGQSTTYTWTYPCQKGLIVSNSANSDIEIQVRLRRNTGAGSPITIPRRSIFHIPAQVIEVVLATTNDTNIDLIGLTY